MISQMAFNIAILLICSIFIVHIPIRIFAICVTYYVIRKSYNFEEHVAVYKGVITDWQKNPGLIRTVTKIQMSALCICLCLYIVL